MVMSYAEEKIKEALKLSKGNISVAQKQIIEWAMQDHDLLVAIVKPHMVGITAHAVNRVASGKNSPESVSRPVKTSAGKINKDSFGMDILKTIAGGNTAQFGQENYSRPIEKRQASQRHIDAIHQIIKNAESKK